MERFSMKAVASLLGGLVVATSLVACGSKSKASSAPAPTAAPTTTTVAGAAARPDVPPNGGGNRVTGTVKSIDNGTVTLSDGTSFTLAPAVRVVRMQTISASDLQKGQYVA